MPDYLKEDFFVGALKESLPDVHLTVNIVTFAWDTNPGDNYCSRVYHVSVAYKRLVDDNEPSVQEQRSLIVKTVPVN